MYLVAKRVHKFDWDKANFDKCQKHGVSSAGSTAQDFLRYFGVYDKLSKGVQHL